MNTTISKFVKKVQRFNMTREHLAQDREFKDLAEGLSKQRAEAFLDEIMKRAEQTVI